MQARRVFPRVQFGWIFPRLRIFMRGKLHTTPSETLRKLRRVGGEFNPGLMAIRILRGADPPRFLTVYKFHAAYSLDAALAFVWGGN